MMNNNPETIFLRNEKRGYNPERTLIAAIIRQAWEDSFMRFSSIGGASKSQKKREADLARLFLTGNYSRELLKEYCEALDMDPNYIIKIAMTCYWAKDITPRYFI